MTLVVDNLPSRGSYSYVSSIGSVSVSYPHSSIRALVTVNKVISSSVTT